MKTLKFIMIAMMLGIVGSTFAQSTKAAANSSVFLVQVPHTKEQCMNMMSDMKGKGDAFLSKFQFGCMSGDHTAYAFLEGASEESIRQMLPPDEQKAAKIEKVDKFTAAQIEKMHKDHM
jgi:hypothetical protein